MFELNNVDQTNVFIQLTKIPLLNSMADKILSHMYKQCMGRNEEKCELQVKNFKLHAFIMLFILLTHIKLYKLPWKNVIF